MRILLAVILGAAVVGLGISPVWSRPEPQQGQDRDTVQQGPNLERARMAQQRLSGMDQRLITLARRVLQERGTARKSRDELWSARIDEKKAEADYINAKLIREVAEIAVKEYVEGVFVQDRLATEGEISVARTALERGRDLIKVARERQAQIKEVADNNTAYGRMINYQFEDKIEAATLELERRKLALEAAESKLNVLLNYTRDKTIKELESAVKAAHSDELAKQATWEVQKAKVEKLRKMEEPKWPTSAVGKRLLALLDQAIPLQEKAHAKLDEYRKLDKHDAAVFRKVDDLTNQLSGVIKDAEAAWTVEEFNGLRSDLKWATRQ